MTYHYLISCADAGDDYDHYHMNESTADCKLFWTHDIVKMAQELKAYLKPGAEQALEDFKQSRKKLVNFDVKVRFPQAALLNLTASKHAAVCSAWSDDDDSLRLSRAREFRAQNTVP
jgi:hypothetical protein